MEDWFQWESGSRILKWFKENALVLLMTVLLVVAFVIAGWLAYEFLSSHGGKLFPLDENLAGSGRDDVQVNSNRGEWGATGDFFGGFLNPIFALFGLMMLLATLIQSHRELSLTRKELELTRKEAEASKQALQDQAKTQEQQRFESTFFSLLDAHNALLRQVQDLKYEFPWREVSTPEEARTKLRNDIDGTEYGAIKTYLRFLYQVLKFLKESNGNDGELIASPEEKRYSNLVRSFVDNDTGELVLINAICLGSAADDQWGFHKYRQLIERYAFLEHVQLDLGFGQLQESYDAYSVVKTSGEYFDELKSFVASFHRNVGGSFSGFAYMPIDHGERNLQQLGQQYDRISFVVLSRFHVFDEMISSPSGVTYYDRAAYGDGHFYRRVKERANYRIENWDVNEFQVK